jgi:hypothetical protein
MTDEHQKTLRPASADEIEQGLAFALRFDGRKRALHGDEFMARITAQRLVRWLEKSGFVVMKKPPSPPHSTTIGERRGDGTGSAG